MKLRVFVTLAVAVSFSCGALAQNADITLPAPQTTGGKPLMECLKERKTTRTFSERKIEPQVMSNLLWAAAGINRADTMKRTVPSAKNWQEVDVYAITEQGAYVYDAKTNAMKNIATADLRKLAGMQDFVATAPLNLAYVADTTKMQGASIEDQARYAGADAAFMIQNVYLYCASEGLATVVRGSVDRKALGTALKLPPEKQIVLVQTVGYPANGK